MRSDQTLCHCDNETRHLLHPERECEIDASLRLYGCKYEHRGRAGRDACERAVLFVYGEVWGREKSGSQGAQKTEHFKRNAIYSLFTVFSGKSVSHRIMSAYCTDDTAV